MQLLAKLYVVLHLVLQDRAELLYCNLRFNWTFIVPVSWGTLGNVLIVFVTSSGTFTTLPLILNCFPLGACKIFWNANLGARGRHSNSFRSKKFGFLGNFIPFAIAHGGTLFFFKYLLHDWQSHSILSTLIIFCKCLIISGFVNRVLSAGETLCLYQLVTTGTYVQRSLCYQLVEFCNKILLLFTFRAFTFSCSFVILLLLA
jgi:hypothetical protein